MFTNIKNNFVLLGNNDWTFDRNNRNVIKLRRFMDSNCVEWLMGATIAEIWQHRHPTSAVHRYVSRSNMLRPTDLLEHIENVPTFDKYIKRGYTFVNRRGLIELALQSARLYAYEFRYWVVNVLFESLNVDVVELFQRWCDDSKNRARVMEDLPASVTSTRGHFYVVSNDLYSKLTLYRMRFTKGTIDDDLKDLNADSPFDYYVVYACESKDCRILCMTMHEYLKEKRVRGDFFLFNADDIDTVRTSCDHLENNN
ncbi:Bro3 [Heliothis virescens ascovirus 3g]|uniref:Bro3 n=1 Tax=Heliothis virescens ascovirus 3g TaxID=1246651 RepID=K4P976_9VIRU|nr:Bro3 [Heliothis virescens ascovirus 3g]AFV50294.1 Bro3 [Heliothis virescens ascovirus 3g]